MISLTLITNTSIVSKIFTLIANQLNLKIEIANSIENIKQSDIVILDEEFVNNINISTAKNLSHNKVAIISKNIPMNNDIDFTIPRPFLPSTLSQILEEEIVLEKVEILSEQDNAIDYLDTLVDDISEDICESDESIINL